MNTFREMQLDAQILKGIDAAGFAKPFPIQERAIGPLLAGLDVIAQARTGTGKTAAYGLPMLQSIKREMRQVQALVLAPTRELAVQITDEIKRLGRFSGAKVLTVYGGQSINVQIEGLRRGAHVIIGTPGRVIDHLKRGTLELGWVRSVVLDEADTMLEMGFVDDVEFILDSVPNERQMSLFSATMPQEIIQLSRKYMRDPERILIDSDEPSVDTLEQHYAIVEEREKLPTLLELLDRERPVSAMVFCRTRHGARRLARELERHLLNVVPLHGDLSQRQRDHSMNLFRSGRADILVATDVASRGIDVRQVQCVINYQVPQDPLLYFHRVGRTARAGDPGSAYTFVSGEELKDFSRIRSLTKAPIAPMRPEDERPSSYFAHLSVDRPRERFRGRRYSRGSRNQWRRYR